MGSYNISQTVRVLINDQMSVYCIRIRTRGGIYGKIWPEPEGLPKGAARGQSQGLRPYFTVYPDLSPNTDIIQYPIPNNDLLRF